MNTTELNQILDAEIKFSETTPLAKQLPSEFVRGFVAGLKQAQFLISAKDNEIEAVRIKAMLNGLSDWDHVLVKNIALGSSNYTITYSGTKPQ